MKVFLLFPCLALIITQCHSQTQEELEQLRYDWDVVTPLDEYVHREDGWFSWKILSEYRYDRFNATLYNINMTAQKWMDETFSSRPIWFHIMHIAIPDSHIMKYPDAALMAITGGGNNNARPADQDDISNIGAAVAAAETGTVCAYIKQIPNQSIVFNNDPDQLSKSEDRIISWTWKEYIDMKVKNTDAIIRMAMTKSVKRGLDTIAEVAKFKAGLDIKRFGITGASKRGWTTWSLAAVDKRVVIMWPMVFSLLDMTQSVMNHYRALDGQYAWAIKDYYEAGMMKSTRNLDMTKDVLDAEDMIRFAPRFTIPKVLLASVGDEFFSPTDSHPWWHKMPGPKYFLMFANAEHTMAPHYLKLAKTLLGTWHMFMRGEEWPTLTWERSETGSNPNRVGHIRFCFKPDMLPNRIIAFYATTNNKTEGRRDFRMLIAENRPCGYDMPNGGCQTEPHLYLWRRDELDVADLDSSSCMEYTRPQPAPDSENIWTGFVIEAQFNGTSIRNYPIHVTTEVQMVPDRFPHEPCPGPDPVCHTNLV